MKNILIFLSLFVASAGLTQDNKQYIASPNARFTLLSCTSGPDLYSIFGHTAIRYEDSLNGRWVDWVFNYGTFEFSDDFYWKFAQGKLDYKLSLEDFGNFQQEYIYTGRGIYEQELLLTVEDKRKLFALLVENYEPQNRTYRYDFFYDNCATRVRDIIRRSSSRSVEFTYVSAKEWTFRDAIQRYLDHMPWSDFGIDLALGIPCDRVMGKEDVMFLPDSLMNDFTYASYGDGVLTSPATEVLPFEYELGDRSLITPINVFGLLLFIQILIGGIVFRKYRKYTPVDRLHMLLVGLVGVLVFFLWFFTDHTATKWNLNLLWANPINFILVFVSWKRSWVQAYFKWNTILLIILVVSWFFLPQRLHLAALPMVLGLIFIGLRSWRPGLFAKEKRG
ncbi:MAG: DUF4105 domain-containing protein [Flavobacteriales bacterium]|jgi:hypothetical protein